MEPYINLAPWDLNPINANSKVVDSCSCGYGWNYREDEKLKKYKVKVQLEKILFTSNKEEVRSALVVLETHAAKNKYRDE